MSGKRKRNRWGSDSYKGLAQTRRGGGENISGKKNAILVGNCFGNGIGAVF